MKLNSATFSGEVVSVEDCGKGRLLLVKQKVNGKMETSFPVYLPEHVLSEMKEPEVGKSVVIENALVYQKEPGAEFRFRISSPGQFQEVQNEFFLGEEDAKEAFM